MPFGMGGIEWVIILVIILVLFGPSQLPKLGKMFGKTMKQVREGMDSINEPAEEPKAKADNTKAKAAGAEDAEDDEE